MRRIFSRLLGRATSPARRPRPTNGVLRLQVLDDRLVPSGVNVTASGDLEITGTPLSDNVRVILKDVNNFEVIDTQADGLVPRTTVPVARGTSGRVTFHGYAGSDSFENSTSLRAVANGGAGADTLVGGSGNDVLEGDSGAGDFLIGGLDVLGRRAGHESPERVPPGRRRLNLADPQFVAHAIDRYETAGKVARQGQTALRVGPARQKALDFP